MLLGSDEDERKVFLLENLSERRGACFKANGDGTIWNEKQGEASTSTSNSVSSRTHFIKRKASKGVCLVSFV